MNEQSTLKVSFGARRNLGNYEHQDASAEVTCVNSEADAGEKVTAMLADLRRRVYAALSDTPADTGAEKEPAKKRGRPKKEAEPAEVPVEDDAQVVANLRTAASEAVGRTSAMHVIEYLQTTFGVGKVAQLAPEDRAAALKGLRELDVEKDVPAEDPLVDDVLGDL